MPEFEQNRIQDIYMCLKNSGLNVYFPAQHQGECITPYVVVKSSSNLQFRQYSTVVQYYDLLCYVPKDRYSALCPYVDKVKAAMKQLFPMITPAHYDTESFYDDTVKGHMISIQYQNYKKL